MMNTVEIANSDYIYLMDVLGNVATDYQQLVADIAKVNPQLVVQAAKVMNGDMQYSPNLQGALAVVRTYHANNRGGEKIRQIKELRDIGLSLKEAKQLIDEAHKILLPKT